ncbi:YraN family protein [Zhongshania sp.]|jgi:putative endonuclease|uniref:YraN family protein n=1 Tax=Zhongshania sp. TaxID=1971902 RepID=UPI0039E5230A
MIFKRRQSAQAGAQAERGARGLLKDNNLKILHQNYRSRFGEIDIIALSDSHLIFVEVRYRQSTAFGSPAETVNNKKQQRIIRTAKHFLSRGEYAELPCRFDVIEVGKDESGKFRFNWLTDAFQE